VRYLLLITGEQPSEPTWQAEMDQIMGEYWAFDKAVADAGVKVGGEALQGLETGPTSWPRIGYWPQAHTAMGWGGVQAGGEAGVPQTVEETLEQA
jgi:hypothetical protein